MTSTPTPRRPSWPSFSPASHAPHPGTAHYVALSLLEAGGFRLRLHPAVAGGTFTDMAAKVKEQNLAVFGESGSGKTVLLSSFYGASQEPSFLAESLYKVLADDTGQGTRLRAGGTTYRFGRGCRRKVPDQDSEGWPDPRPDRNPCAGRGGQARQVEVGGGPRPSAGRSGLPDGGCDAVQARPRPWRGGPPFRQESLVNLVWATRGRTWGFRFLLDGDTPIRSRSTSALSGEPRAIRPRADASAAMLRCDSLTSKDAGMLRGARSPMMLSSCRRWRTRSAPSRTVSGLSGRFSPMLSPACGTCLSRPHQTKSRRLSGPSEVTSGRPTLPSRTACGSSSWRSEPS